MADRTSCHQKRFLVGCPAHVQPHPPAPAAAKNNNIYSPKMLQIWNYLLQLSPIFHRTCLHLRHLNLPLLTPEKTHLPQKIIIAELKDRFRTRLTVHYSFSWGFVSNHPLVPFANLNNPRDKTSSYFITVIDIFAKVTFNVAIHVRPTKSKQYISLMNICLQSIPTVDDTVIVCSLHQSFCSPTRL